MRIHPTAILSVDAKLGKNVRIGPYAVVEGGVEIGDGCTLSAHSYIYSGTTLGARCSVHPGAIIGNLPQDLSFAPTTPSGVVIGRDSVIREGATIHRATVEGANTIIGDNCYLMAYSHVAHDCVVNDNVIIANNSLLAGHVNVGERAFISGNSAIHQFCRIGRIAMIGGLSRVNSDVPPFMIMELDSTVRGVNLIGVRRAGFNREQIQGIKKAYHILYHEGLQFREAYKVIEEEIPTPEALELVEFCRGTKRGICRHF